MFKSYETGNLLFQFEKKGRYPIHSFFVFFPFLVLWLNNKNKVIEYKLVKPFKFRVVPKRHFSKIIEIPVNTRNKKIIKFFVGKERFK